MQARAIDGFDDIVVRTKLTGLFGVLRFMGAAKNNYLDPAKEGAFRHPAEDIETAASRHFKIEENDVGLGKVSRVRKTPFVLKIIKSVEAVVGDEKRRFRLGPVEGVLKEKAIVGRVFNQENIQ